MPWFLFQNSSQGMLIICHKKLPIQHANRVPKIVSTNHYKVMTGTEIPFFVVLEVVVFVVVVSVIIATTLAIGIKGRNNG